MELAMTMLVMPDLRGRLSLGRAVRGGQYAVTLRTTGAVTLIPVENATKRDFEASMPVVPSLFASEVFGPAGTSDLLHALEYNGARRGAGDAGQWASTASELHALLWNTA